MKTYYVDENNSHGFTVALGVLDEPQPHWVSVEAENVDDAIHQFEEHFKLDWNYQNSYEGNSCNCCGRRFTIYTPGEEESDYDEYDMVEEYGDGGPWFTIPTEDDADELRKSISRHDKGCPLSECPLKE